MTEKQDESTTLDFCSELMRGDLQIIFDIVLFYTFCNFRHSVQKSARTGTPSSTAFLITL
jgi:hypothetical protein